MTSLPLYTEAISRPLDKAALRCVPQSITRETIPQLKEGRFSFTTPNATYEGFLQPSDTKRMYVLLSSAGRMNSDIRFSRISWGGLLNGITLNVEDPMYRKHPGLSVGWYYGTPTVSYLDEIAELVRALAELNGVPPANVIFVGSSAGGTAALFLADKVRGSTALAMNPQVIPNSYHYARRFEGITGTDLRQDDPFGRNSLRRVSDNTQSRFIVTCNLLSREDYQVQILPWLTEEGIAPENSQTPALITHKSLNFVLHNTPATNLHNTFLDLEHFAMLLPAIMSGRPLRADEALPVFTSLRSKLRLEQNGTKQSFWLDLLSELQKPDLFRFETDKSTYLQLKASGLPAECSFKISTDEGFSKFRLSVILRNTPATVGKPFQEKLSGLASEMSGHFIPHRTWSVIEIRQIPRQRVATRTASAITIAMQRLSEMLYAPDAPEAGLLTLDADLPSQTVVGTSEMSHSDSRPGA